MLNIDSIIINESCTKCNHHDYCQVYWGKECKRQGGKRTPKIKTKRLIKEKAFSKPTTKQLVKNKSLCNPITAKKCKTDQPGLTTAEPIRTRRVQWAI